MFSFQRVWLGAALILAPGFSAAASRPDSKPAPVSKTVLKNLPEKAIFRTVAVQGKLYAFQYVDDDATPSDKLAAGGNVYVYDAMAAKWEARARMPVMKAGYSIVALNDKVYIIGGLTAPDTPSGSVEEYDPAANAWTGRKSMPTPRCRMGAVVLDGRIYAMGGKVKEGVVTGAVEAYDPIKDAWSVRRSLSKPVMGVAAAAANGKIYKLKGTELSGRNFNMLLDFEEYDPAADIWTKKAPWIWEKEPLEVVVADGRLFVVGAGAYTDSNARSLKEYVFASDRWVFRRDMPAASAHTIHPSWTVLGGRIYTFGGGYRVGDAWMASDRAQRYDPATDTWDELPPMAERKMGMGVSAAGGRIFVVGGEKMEGSWEAGRNPFSGAVEVYEVGAGLRPGDR
jgi:N-acetylneuraminic acid mutarotase